MDRQLNKGFENEGYTRAQEITWTSQYGNLYYKQYVGGIEDYE
jgi:hypothetical protein